MNLIYKDLDLEGRCLINPCLTFLYNRGSQTVSYPDILEGTAVPYAIYNQVDLNTALPDNFNPGVVPEESGFELGFVMYILGLGTTLPPSSLLSEGNYFNACKYAVLVNCYPDIEHKLGKSDWNNKTYKPGHGVVVTDTTNPTSATITQEQAYTIITYGLSVCPNSILYIVQSAGLLQQYIKTLKNNDYRKRLACIVCATAIMQRHYYETHFEVNS